MNCILRLWMVDGWWMVDDLEDQSVFKSALKCPEYLKVHMMVGDRISDFCGLENSALRKVAGRVDDG